MTKKLYITMSPSGGGKNFYVDNTLLKTHPNLCIASADNYFMENGVYKFELSRLGAAHQNCEQTAQTGMAKGLPIVVLNTNVKWEFFKVYLRQAAIFGYTVEFLIFDIPEDKLDVLFARNVHGVPKETIVRKWNNLQECRKNLKKNMRTMFPELTYTITTIPFQE